MDNESEKFLNEKEMFCLSKHVQELKEIVCNSCSTCKYQKECVKNGFSFEKETLLHLERITDNVCRKSLGHSKKLAHLEITLDADNNAINIGKVADALARKLIKCSSKYRRRK
ncbi:hypothetical protein Ccar_16575 [Clostridium carboxidivorans P7]|uniref:hypothetical protein n=1 Tax=Clostridium carboxidivorans TaxID=217159 RepID=UPI00064F600B|nr:hypothetical protein [Clostridium carboxidivorans]AKN32388.1 hypothetical protein Ccar_16575 [Clostridium carboxidivorans P7]